MGRLVKSRSYHRRVKTAFGDDEVSALIARMAVLFEDLRIEYNAAKLPDKIDALDVLPSIYRKFYFLRRSTVTLVEFMGAFEYLNQRPEFAPVRKSLDKTAISEWEAAREFFKINKERLKTIRNDYGGHFQLRTARKVLADMHHDTVSSVEIVFNNVNSTAQPRLQFAYEIVAHAFVMHKPEEEETQPFIRELFETIWAGWQHCVNVMHVVMIGFILPRFR